MPIEKVIRIVSLFLLLAAFSLHVASRLLFPDASHAGGLPIWIVVLYCLLGLWRKKPETADASEDEEPANR